METPVGGGLSRTLGESEHGETPWESGLMSDVDVK